MATDLLSIFRSDVGRVRVRRNNVRDELEQARRRREELQTLALPPDEICDVLLAVLDRRAAEFEGRLAGRVRSMATNFIAHEDGGPGAQMSSVLTNSQNACSGQEIEGLLALLVRDQVRASLLKTINAMGLKCGPARADRVVELNGLETKIKDLEGQAKAITAELDALREEIGD